MTITLYQFPISHYCEKIRWALDYKGLEYRSHNLAPGQHLKVTKKMAKKSHVPILDHDGIIVQGSAAILTYLDDTFPDKRLTPGNPDDAKKALEWEQYLDQEIGVHVRRYAYFTLLDHPDIVLPILTTGVPFWPRNVFKLMFPKVRTVMRKYMNINTEGAAESKQHLQQALDKLNDAISQQPFLVNGEFSRADLTAAALLAPLFMPDKYGLPWPRCFPEPLHTEVEAMRDKLQWAEGIYRDYR